MKKVAASKKELDEYEAVFFALSHQTRRHILMCLSEKGGPMLGGEIADQFSCSWPTTTSHLQNLEKAGLVTVQKQGREQLYELSPKRLGIIEKWINLVRG